MKLIIVKLVILVILYLLIKPNVFQNALPHNIIVQFQKHAIIVRNIVQCAVIITHVMMGIA